MKDKLQLSLITFYSWASDGLIVFSEQLFNEEEQEISIEGGVNVGRRCG